MTPSPDDADDEPCPDTFVRRQVRVDLAQVHPLVAKRTLAKFARTIQAEARVAAQRTRRVSWYTVDDYCAVAQVATLEALVSYREGCGAVFGTWVRRVVRWRLNETAARLLQQQQCHEPDAFDAADAGADVDAPHQYARHVDLDERQLTERGLAGVGTPEDAVSEAEALARVLHAAKSLSWREQEALYAALNDQSGASLGRQLGLTRQRIHHHRTRALARLATALGVSDMT